MIWILAGLGVLAVLSVLVVFFGARFGRSKLSAAHRSTVEAHLQQAQSLEDYGRMVMEADAVLHQALKLMGYQGSFADCLKSMGARFGNLEDIWWMHKLRNKVAHEPGYHITKAQAERSLKIVERALRDLS